MEGQQMLLEFSHPRIQMRKILVRLANVYLIRHSSPSIDRLHPAKFREEKIQTIALYGNMYFV